jgi:MoxR-like ATPase
VQPVLDRAGLLAARAEVQAVAVDDPIVEYTTRLVRATRESPDLVLGSSVRGAIALLLAAKALAAVRGRAYVVPDDVKELARPALRHRVLLNFEGEAEGVKTDDLLQEILKHVPETAK